LWPGYCWVRITLLSHFPINVQPVQSSSRKKKTAESQGKHFLYRTGAAFVSTRLGIRSKAPISAIELSLPSPRQTGGLIVAGSYVPKTTAQLKVLTDRRGPTGQLAIIEIKVEELIASPETASKTIAQIVKETEEYLKAGKDTLVMTSRKLITGGDEISSLKIGSAVAEALVSVLQRIEVRPRYIIAKVLSQICSTWG
jgi:uncharacterized protein YgbK (DUF1537 family)